MVRHQPEMAGVFPMFLISEAFLQAVLNGWIPVQVKKQDGIAGAKISKLY